MSTALFNLAGRTALVTGSSRGLGNAIAEGFAAVGAALILNGSDPSSFDSLLTSWSWQFVGKTQQIDPFPIQVAPNDSPDE